MLERDLGNLASQEVLREAVEAFNKIKTADQDRFLERTVVVPDDEIKDIVKEFEIQEEIAKAVFVLEYEYDIPRKLSANYLTFIHF